MLKKIFVSLMCALPLGAHAGEWAGEAGLGYLAADGNAQTRSINGKVLVDYRKDNLKNSFNASAVNSSDGSETTAERYSVGNQLNVDFTPKDYVFAVAEYEKDLFGGIRERTSEALGYGRHLLTGPRHLLDAEIGAGARQAQQQGTGDHQDEFIGRASGRYEWKLSETSAFHQSLKIESGASNTYLESVTELKLSIIGNLFAALSYTVKRNSGAPAGTEKIDTFTAVNLTYTFGKKP